MYIRLVVTYCNKDEKLLPIEAHIDNHTSTAERHHQILKDCMEILNKKTPEIKKMVPSHLKNKDFKIIIYGDYLRGYDYIEKYESWSNGEPIFNVQQLGLPEEHKPIIKTT